MSARFIVRFDDITPNMAWSKFSIFEDFLLEYNIKPIIGVVPNCKDEKLYFEESNLNFWGKIQFFQKNGWAIAQHGYTHQYETNNGGILGINKNSEFAGLPYNVQLEKITKGKAILQEKNVWQPIFMAPSHSFDENTIKALQYSDFKYITDGYGVYPYKIKNLIAIPQLFSKPFHFGYGIYTICIHVNTMNEMQIRNLIKSLKNIEIISFYDSITMQPSIKIIESLSKITTEKFIKSLRTLKKVKQIICVA